VTVAPPGVERDYSLARLTTVRAGGGADFFARPKSEGELVGLLGWAESEGIAIAVVGSGSNLLVSDDGFRGLVLKQRRRRRAGASRGSSSGSTSRAPSAAQSV
jgi:UDP-N-acetylmuramate dehydrogenase